MKRFALLAVSGAIIASGLSSCSDSDEKTTNEGELSQKEEMFKAAAADYVDHTVLPTYGAMADAAIELCDLCNVIREKHEAGTLSTTDIANAGTAWKLSRKSWELSEAFLYGPAANHNIDPHIDSWPLDKQAMDDLLANIRAGHKWSLTNNGGYGLIGFHAIEYMLYELSADGNTSVTHSTAYTPEELTYLCAVAEDLRDQCVCLEACWAGLDNISDEKQQILEEAELDYDEEYGYEMKNARQAGSRYKTFQHVAEEIIQGCIDIADEVGNTKIGRPHHAASEEDTDYIESPYSLNSIEDFVDNIISVRNAYTGSRNGDASVSDYIKLVDPELDTRLRNAIDNAIKAIEAIPEPFTKTATGPEAANAVKAVGQDLVDALEEVADAVAKQ